MLFISTIWYKCSFLRLFLAAYLYYQTEKKYLLVNKFQDIESKGFQKYLKLSNAIFELR